ncbi:shikimate kinase [Amnibacterium setariae]|uniref:Shikimate kinase n=1 Tax=Amnibacterium setariae TaxID=2306585 RepID=A0A3A1U334_9MICO|nr:shikimate kinase [Amnibacterium setariae]
MGAGKTSVGRRVAKHLGRRFVDTDAVIAAEHAPIPQLFVERGEAAFRAIERDVVQRELATGGVVALGGGAVLDATTRAALAGCTVVLLTVSEQAVAARIGDGRRPLLTDGLESWRRIAAEREPVYAALADVVVDTSRRPMTTIAAELAAQLQEVAP